jgi:hypothetical protein
MCRHGLRTRKTKRSSMGHMDDVIDSALSTFETISPAVMIGADVVDGGQVITRTVYGCCSKWDLIIICAHIIHLVFMSLQICVDEYPYPS